MRNTDAWRPTKFIPSRDGWRASPLAVPASSRVVADILAQRYTAALERHAAGQLLDLGCGLVPLFGAYRERVLDAVCVDWPESRHPSPHLDYELDLNRPLPLASSTFDTILATDLLEHIAHPEQLFAEISRLLRSGGKLILGVPFFYRIHEAPHDHFRYTGHRLRLFCEENDLDVLELEPYGGSPEIVSDLVGKHLAMVSPWLARLTFALSCILLRWGPIRRLSRATSRAFPLGYLLVAERR